MDPIKEVSEVQSYLEVCPFGNGEDASVFYDYKKPAVDLEGFWTEYKLNAKKVMAYLKGKEIDKETFSREEIDEKRKDAKPDEYDTNEFAGDILAFEENEKYYVVVWTNAYNVDPAIVFETDDMTDIDELRLFRVEGVIGFDFEGEYLSIYTDGHGYFEEDKLLEHNFYDKTGVKSDLDAWKRLAAMQKLKKED